jgi:hypothetical protein
VRSLGDRVDVTNPALSFDRMHLTAEGNELIAAGLVEAGHRDGGGATAMTRVPPERRVRCWWELMKKNRKGPSTGTVGHSVGIVLC